MKVVLQRVLKSSVTVDGKIIGAIDKGYMLLLGVADSDTKKDVEVLVDKIAKVRLFEDAEGKTNLSIADIDGEVLVISQFTLYADLRKGNRPSFSNSAKPDYANELYEYFKEYCKGKFKKVECGEFGADMKVELINDGPFTVLYECVDGSILN